jgi:hypothetical protein
MSEPYKPKPGRVKDKVRKAPSKPAIEGSGTFSGGGGFSAQSQVGEVPYKPKPPRKGRPDGA